MPEFELVTLSEAQSRTAFAGRRGANIREYIDYIQQVGPDLAGRLRAVGGEKITTVRRRLGQAAQALGANLVIKRSSEELYFWVGSTGEERPRRGRRSRGRTDELGDLQ
jgi:hypothetical protein